MQEEPLIQEGPIRLPVVLIGPVNAGKSTVAPLLAGSLGVPHVSLDERSWEYFEEMGYDADMARGAFERGGQDGARDYMSQFYPGAVERVLQEHPRAVIEFGAGHSVYDDGEEFALVEAALSPHPNVVLLLPSPHADESIRVLTERESNPYPEVVAMNEYFVRNPSNARLAKLTVYTEGRTPEETAREIITRLAREVPGS